MLIQSMGADVRHGTGSMSWLTVFPRMVFASLFLFLLSFAAGTSDAANQNSWWISSENKDKVRLILQDQLRLAEQQLGAGNAGINRDFAQRVNESFPGSRFSGMAGGIIVVDGVSFNVTGQQFNVISAEKKTGNITERRLFTGLGSYSITDGINTVEAAGIDNPSKLYFQVDIPSLSLQSEKTLAARGGDKKVRDLGGLVVFIRTPLGQLVTDAYNITPSKPETVAFVNALMFDRSYVVSLLKMATTMPATTANQQTLVPRQYHVSQQHLKPNTDGNVLGLLLIGGVFLVMIRKIKAKKSREKVFPDHGPSPASYQGVHSNKILPPVQQKNHQLPRPTEWSLDLLMELEWKRYEIVCSRYLDAAGYATRETSFGPDGGVDIEFWDKNKRFGIAQCKAQQKYVGEKALREFYGVMKIKNVESGIFFSRSGFSPDAKKGFAGLMELVDGRFLIAKIKSLPQSDQRHLLNIATEGDYKSPTCAKCGNKMKPSGKKWICQGCSNSLYVTTEFSENRL